MHGDISARADDDDHENYACYYHSTFYMTMLQ